MYGTVAKTRVKAENRDKLREVMEKQTAANVPGFVAGYWTRHESRGVGMIVFESEEAAQAMGERFPSMVPDMVSLEQVEVLEVVAHA